MKNRETGTEKLALYCGTDTMNTKREAGKQRTSYKCCTDLALGASGPAPRGDLLSVAELERVHDAREMKAPGTDVGEVFTFSRHFGSYSYSR